MPRARFRERPTAPCRVRPIKERSFGHRHSICSAGAEVERPKDEAAGRSQGMKSPYGDCYYCGGEVLEREVDLDFRWGGRLFIIERVPTGVCQQCGEKFFTAAVSEELDQLVKSARIDRTVEVPVKVFQRAVA